MSSFEHVFVCFALRNSLGHRETDGSAMLEAPVRLLTCRLMPRRESYRDFVHEEMDKICQWYLSPMGNCNMMGFITFLLTFMFLV